MAKLLAQGKSLGDDKKVVQAVQMELVSQLADPTGTPLRRTGRFEAEAKAAVKGDMSKELAEAEAAKAERRRRRREKREQEKRVKDPALTVVAVGRQRRG